MFYDYDFSAAEREFERSIELNPRYATAYQWFGLSLAMTGPYEEGFTELKRAIRLDPHSAIIHACLGMAYWCGRRYEQQIEHFKKTLELDPGLAQGRWGLACAYLNQRMYEPAIAEMRKALQVLQNNPMAVAFLGEAYAAAGYRNEAQKILEQLKELSKQRYVTPYYVGRIYAAPNETDKALDCLETAYREHAVWAVFLKLDPRLDGLRSEPRFQDLLRRMNFPANP